jgi:hypothetical protein
VALIIVVLLRQLFGLVKMVQNDGFCRRNMGDGQVFINALNAGMTKAYGKLFLIHWRFLPIQNG